MTDLHAGIREISIKDFRGIDELRLSFVDPRGYPTQIVVLGGPNGSGKTAVLEACLLACGHESLVRGKVGREAVRAGQSDYQIDAVVQIQQGKHAVRCTSGGRGQSAAQLALGVVVPFLYFSSWRASNLPGAIGITAGRRDKRPAKTEENRLWIIKQYFVNFRAHDLYSSSSSSGEPPRESGFSAAIQDLDRAWQMFYPDQSFKVEPVSDEPDSGFDMFLLRPNLPRLSVDLMSSGQIELLTFAGGLIQEKSPQGIIVIDEPELHLDPQWHRLVLKAIQFLKPEWQIIVATHSPEVFESVRSFERHFLVPPDDPRAAMWMASSAKETGE
jgi:energy-coupling factor transporter ATP-binding protein EcfA2